MAEKNEKYNFLAQGLVIVTVSFLISKAMISEPNVKGIFSGLSLALENRNFWLIVVVPLLFSPFYFFAALTRKSGQKLSYISVLYAVSMLFSIYVISWSMPLVGIYLSVTTAWFYIYAYRAIHS